MHRMNQLDKNFNINFIFLKIHMYNNINVLLYLLLCDDRNVLLKFSGGGGGVFRQCQ